MRNWIVALIVLVVAGFVLGIAGWLAGSAGVLLGVAVVVAIGLLFGAYLGLFVLPPAARSAASWVIGIGVVSIGAIALTTAAVSQFGSLRASSTVAPGVYWQGTVGEQDEVKVHLPPRSWWDLDIDKTVIIRLANGEKYERRVDGSIFKIEAGGKLTKVETVGDTIPGSVIYLLAKKGEKMAKVAVMVVRKASQETRPAPTVPTSPIVAPPSLPSGVTV